MWHSYSIFADDTWFSSKTHFTLFFRASRDHKFMYHRKGYFGSETSAWIFGFFKKVLHVLSLSNLVTLGRPTKIKTKRTFFNFSSKTFHWKNLCHPMFLKKVKANRHSEIRRPTVQTWFRWITLQSRPMTSLHERENVVFRRSAIATYGQSYQNWLFCSM